MKETALKIVELLEQEYPDDGEYYEEEETAETEEE